MNESIPPIAPLEPAATAYKDRSTGLRVFGVLTILLGCVAGLLVLFMLFGQAAAAASRTADVPPVSLAVILPAVGIYGALAVALIWLGIGSIKARRWARALLLIFSWSWLVMGILTLIVMSFVLPMIFDNMQSNGAANQPALPPAAKAVAMAVAFLFFGVFFVLLPAIWTFFYFSRHVKATCEARDPMTRWTDACPLPVLGLSLWLMISVPMMLLMPLSGHGVMPFFGIFLKGAAGTLFCLALAALWSYAAWLIYHLKPEGWWLIMIAMIVFMASSLMTFAQHDMLEMYQLMGYPQAQIAQIQKSGLLTGNRMGWLAGCSALPFLAYILFVKKYFRAKS